MMRGFKRCGWVLAVISLTVFAADRVQASVVIDFESAPAGPFASYTESGVTFTASGGGGQIITAITPNGTKGLLDDNSPRLELRADIAGGATSVSVDLGDYDADADTLFLEIYNSSGTLLNSTTLLIPDTFTGMETLTLSDPDIAYAIFGARAPALNGSSVYADNFTYTSRNAVPEPSTFLSASMAGLIGLGVAQRRRRRRSLTS